MATYLQWARTRTLRKVTWVCGPEDVLVGEVVSEFRKLEAPCRAFHMPRYARGPAEEDDEAVLWDSLLSWPPGGSLSVVWGAENLRMTGRMAAVTESVPDLAFTVFISAENDFARVTSGGKSQLAPHLAAIQDSRSGQLIRCTAPADEEKLLGLIASWWPGAGLNFARRVWQQSGTTLEAAYHACEIARRAALAPEEGSLEYACCQARHARYADLVIAGQRKEAAEQARQLSGPEVLAALGLLSWRVRVLPELAQHLGRGLDPGEIARKGIDRLTQRELGPHAAAYGIPRVARCRQLLAMAEDAARSGAGDGVLEAVAALW